jgi:tetratricopeptide (TPR) repeat protein
LKKLKQEAIKKFKNRNYQEAFDSFSKILELSPNDFDAKMYLLLSDLAIDDEDQANILFDFFERSKEDQVKSANLIVEEILKSSVLGESVELNEEFLINDNNYIVYKDFMELVQSRGSFRLAFEDTIFSVKIIIDNKDDFIDFIEKLLENGFKNSALNYLESAVLLYPYEEFFQKSLESFKA